MNKEIVIDAVPPSVESSQINGNTIILTFNEDLDSLSIPAANAFSVQVDAVVGYTTVTTVTVDQFRKVILTLADTLLSTQSVYLSYTAPVLQPITDTYANDSAAWSTLLLTNNTPPVIIPSG